MSDSGRKDKANIGKWGKPKWNYCQIYKNISKITCFILGHSLWLSLNLFDFFSYRISFTCRIYILNPNFAFSISVHLCLCCLAWLRLQPPTPDSNRFIIPRFPVQMPKQRIWLSSLCLRLLTNLWISCARIYCPVALWEQNLMYKIWVPQKQRLWVDIFHLENGVVGAGIWALASPVQAKLPSWCLCIIWLEILFIELFSKKYIK